MKTLSALVRIMIAVLFMAPLLAQAHTADEEHYLATANRLRENRATLTKIQEDILSTTDDIRTIKRSKQPAAGKDGCDTCVNLADQYCNHSRRQSELSPCKDGSCEVALQPVNNICYRIFKNKGCYHEALTAALRVKVDRCYLVRKEQDLKDLVEQLSDLNDQKVDSEAERTLLNSELDLLAKRVDVYSLMHDCPDCRISAVEHDHSSRKTDVGDGAGQRQLNTTEPNSRKTSTGN